LVPEEEKRFNEIRKKVRKRLKQQSIFRRNCKFVPISALEGENLYGKKTSKYSWYKGQSLFEELQIFNLLERNVQKPLRLTVSNATQGMV